MIPNNKPLIFTIGTALIFWNPLTFFFVYGSSPVYSITLFKILFWLSLIAGAFCIYQIRNNRFHPKIRNIIFSVSVAAIIFSVLVMIDGAIGVFYRLNNPADTTNDASLFEPNTTAKYHTSEFDFIAGINSIGLRDKEIKTDKDSTFRILCFGDSWTFGWGVNIESSWPKKLEELLKKKGYDNTEVINCGQNGQYTSAYKKQMKKIVPMLKPDLVLAGVLQSDDLAQLYENGFTVQDNVSVQFRLKQSALLFLKESFSNTLFLTKPKIVEADDITTEWKEEAKSMIGSLNHLQLLRFNAFDDSLKILFASGNVNPALLYSYINFPDRHLIINDPQNKATLFALSEMKKDLEEMKLICSRNAAPLIFINLPTSYYTGHNVIRMPGGYYNEYLFRNNKIDSMYRAAASHVNIPYCELTDRFKLLPDKSSWFLKYDGHPTAKGYEEIAGAISDFLSAENLLYKKTENQK